MKYEEAAGIINKQRALKNKREANQIIMKMSKFQGLDAVDFAAIQNDESVITDVNEDEKDEFKVKLQKLKTKSNNKNEPEQNAEEASN